MNGIYWANMFLAPKLIVYHKEVEHDENLLLAIEGFWIVDFILKFFIIEEKN
jgi:hypothetical protein